MIGSHKWLIKQIYLEPRIHTIERVELIELKQQSLIKVLIRMIFTWNKVISSFTFYKPKK